MLRPVLDASQNSIYLNVQISILGNTDMPSRSCNLPVVRGPKYVHFWLVLGSLGVGYVGQPESTWSQAGERVGIDGTGLWMAPVVLANVTRDVLTTNVN